MKVMFKWKVMIKQIYLYRHGETNWNVLDRIMGQKQNISTYFTTTGYKQIKKLSDDLKNNHIDALSNLIYIY